MAKASVKQIAQAINDLSQKSTDDKALAKEIAAYIVAERRSADLGAIMREVARLRSQSGIVEATVTTARPLSDNVRSSIKQLLNSDQAVINEVIDKTVIGGVRIEANEYYLDLTVRNRLNRLKVIEQGVNV